MSSAEAGSGPVSGVLSPAHMELDGYISQLAVQGEALAVAAVAAGLDASVPSCPGWSVRHLLAHIGYVHRWAHAHVAGALIQMADDPSEEEIFSRRPPDDELVAWYRAGCAALVDALRNAPADLRCWTFMAAPSPLGFWARRQAHETAVHRVDAELAGGRPVGYIPQWLAVDGLDEILCGFAPRKRVSQPPGSGWSLAVDVDGAPYGWTVLVGPETVTASRQVSKADCTLSGPPEELYLLLWNRAGTSEGLVRTEGDPSVVERWASFVRVDW